VEQLIRVTEIAVVTAYFPEYVATELGFFAEEGLRMESFAPTSGPFTPALDIEAGTADIAMGGIWRPLMYRGRLETFHVFAQLCDRDARLLLSRKPAEGFTWSQMIGKTVLLPGGAPSPEILMLGILRREGVDPSRIRFIQSLTGAEQTRLFRAGLGDYFLVSRPAADVLISQGVAAMAASFSDVGKIPWSVYYASREFLDRDANVAGRLAKGLQRGLEWTLAHDPMEAPGVFKRFFPKLDPGLVAQSVRDCRARGVWSPTAHVSRPGLEQWQEMIVEYGMLDAPIPYDEIVDSRAADWAARELGR
jgi:ABC-type nitrate/sulfonate/bicarbonate transport system substrate-binding protein